MHKKSSSGSHIGYYALGLHIQMQHRESRATKIWADVWVYYQPQPLVAKNISNPSVPSQATTTTTTSM